MRSLEGVKVIVVAFVGLVALVGLNAYLKDATLRTLAPYSPVIRLGSQFSALIFCPPFVPGASPFVAFSLV
jgi:hypothetical protein